VENSVETVAGWLTAWHGAPPLVAFLVAYCLHFAIYAGWGGGTAISYALFRRNGIGAFLDERPLNPNQVRGEITRSAVMCIVVALVTLACLTQAYGAIPSSFTQFMLELLGLIVVYDLVFYLLHRLLHTPALWRVHGIHHKSVRSTPWSGFSVHPIEAFFLEVPILLFALLFPVSVVTLVVFQFFIHYFSAIGHGNYDPYAKLEGWERLKSLLRFHQLHHARGNVNYSTFGPLVDKLFKTHAP